MLWRWWLYRLSKPRQLASPYQQCGVHQWQSHHASHLLQNQIIQLHLRADSHRWYKLLEDSKCFIFHQLSAIFFLYFVSTIIRILFIFSSCLFDSSPPPPAPPTRSLFPLFSSLLQSSSSRSSQDFHHDYHHNRFQLHSHDNVRQHGDFSVFSSYSFIIITFLKQKNLRYPPHHHTSQVPSSSLSSVISSLPYWHSFSSTPLFREL